MDTDLSGAQRQTRIWHWITAVVAFLAVYRGIRIPNRWSATQAQVNYSQGIVKRGLFGAALSGPLHLYHYGRFALVSFGLLTLLFVLLGVLVFKTLRRGAGNGWEIVAVFAGSYSVTMLASTVGYFDILLASLAVLPLLVSDARWRFALALPLSVCGVMVHEIYVLVFLPVVLLPFALEAIAAKTQRERRRSLAAIVVIALVCGSICVGLAASTPLTTDKVNAMAEQIKARVDFNPRMDFFYVFVRSARANVSMMRVIYRLGWYRMMHVQSVFVFGPTAAFLVWAGRDFMGRQTSVRRGLMLGLFLFCGLSPLLLHGIATDVSRINGLCCLALFLSFLVCVRMLGMDALVSSPWRQGVATMLLVLTASAGQMQMLRPDRSFPDIPQLKSFLEQVRHRSWAEMSNDSD